MVSDAGMTAEWPAGPDAEFRVLFIPRRRVVVSHAPAAAAQVDTKEYT